MTPGKICRNGSEGPEQSSKATSSATPASASTARLGSDPLAPGAARARQCHQRGHLCHPGSATSVRPPVPPLEQRAGDSQAARERDMERQSHAVLAQLLQQGHFVNHFLFILSTHQPSSRICAFPGHLGFFSCPFLALFWKKFNGFSFTAPVLPTKTWLRVCQCINLCC